MFVESDLFFSFALMCNNCYACEFSTTLQQASFGSNFLSYTKEDFECRISATKSCDAVLFFSLSRWADLLEKMGKGREKKGEGGEGGRKSSWLGYVES